MIGRTNIVRNVSKRVLEKNKLSVPIDIYQLVRKYALLEVDNSIPFNFDAVCLFNKPKPEIIYNGDKPDSRIRFTLAHELGHILIPGHRGNIACHFKNQYLSIYDVPLEELTPEMEEFFRREEEADQFASELLLPRFWVKKIVHSNKSYKDAFLEIYNATELSFSAINIAMKSFLDPGMIIIATHMMYGKQVYISARTKVDYDDTLSGKNEAELNNSYKIESFYHDNYEVKVYHLYEDIKIDRIIPQRDISSTNIIMSYLNRIYKADEAKKTFNSINGIIGSLNSNTKVKIMSEEEYLKNVRQKFKGRSNLNNVVNTKEFSDYISQKFFELKNK